MPKVQTLAAAAALILVLLATLTAEAQRRIDPAAGNLPDGDGKIAGACHPAARFVNVRQSPAQWHKTVMSMVARGAQLFPQDVDTVTNYLGAYLSDSSSSQGGK
jgi:hypothetical protein